jgi:mannose-6-phosphate isomerase-like protein (cupin superfamily)
MQGEFHWHKHDHQDELFLVLDGLFRIEVEGRAAVKLGPRDAYLVPRGVRHRPVAPSAQPSSWSNKPTSWQQATDGQPQGRR